MPELPEVEIARRQLERWARRKRIVKVFALRTRVLGKHTPARFAAQLTGARLVSTERRGKNVVALLDRRGAPIGLRLHLGMTGKLSRRKKGDDAPRFSRARLELEDGTVVHYCDLRLFGELEVGPPETVRKHAFDGLGPDPLEKGFGAKLLSARVARSRKPVKQALMDQEKIAGVGNILASESLWWARISPFERADRLDARQWKRLAAGILKAIHRTLDEEDGEEIVYVEEPGSDSNPFLVYDRANEPCRRCKTPISRTVQGGRSTYWCRKCQP